MGNIQLSKDPYNIIITGVGGQGNVMASRILANMLVKKGYCVTIGESFGASQRGGSVMSHLRVSRISSWSPQIPKGGADVVIALEPVEAIRVLKDYGNPEVKILSNTRAISPVGVIAGEQDYPSMEEIRKSAKDLSSSAWFIDATDEGLRLGNPILGNIIMLGALSGVGVLPMDREGFKGVISRSIPEDKIDINLKAYVMGEQMVKV
ncbi:MAG: indolepyruvate oxidoreductase subunit beta [Thermodesulfobacteriota bacterium]|nr:indolepyruvate oxidoreductase subunit beta [Thermodesulfobacteriota bacterium]